jgi:hypothetical protein
MPSPAAQSQSFELAVSPRRRGQEQEPADGEDERARKPRAEINRDRAGIEEAGLEELEPQEAVLARLTREVGVEEGDELLERLRLGLARRLSRRLHALGGAAAHVLAVVREAEDGNQQDRPADQAEHGERDDRVVAEAVHERSEKVHGGAQNLKLIMRFMIRLPTPIQRIAPPSAYLVDGWLQVWP